jgi:Phosphoadenosine phosphosulfate reductase family
MKHVVALSGGKDSTALALRLAEAEPRDYVFVCTPTGNEPDEMFEHWRKLGLMLGTPILPITYKTGLTGLIREQKMIPNFRARFCTRIMKIEPYRAWLALNAPIVSYVGLRADEEGRAGGAYGDIPGVEMRFPLREWGWGLDEVIGYNAHRGITIPRRTDCKWCFHQRIVEWFELWRDDLPSWMEGECIEDEMGATFRTPGRDSWPTSMRELRTAFEGGRRPKAIQLSMPLIRQSGECRVCTI